VAVLYRWQYQAKAEPVLKPEDFVHVSTWFRQASEPVWGPERSVDEGWGSSLSITEPTLFVEPPPSWMAQHPVQTEPDEFPAWGASVIDPLPPLPFVFDWQVQHESPFLGEEQNVQEGAVFSITEPTLFVVQNLSWIVQHPTPPEDDAPNVAEGFHVVTSMEVFASQNLGWLFWWPDPLPDDDPTAEGESRSITEPTLFISQNLSWLVQHEEPIPEEPIVIQEWTATGFVPIREQNLDWIVQHPDPPLESPGTHEGAIRFLVDPTIFISQSLAWIVQHPEPQPDPLMPDEGASVQVFGFPAGTPTFTVYGAPFLYTAANWANASFYFEVYMRASSGIVQGRLWDKTAAADVGVSGSTVTGNSLISTSFERTRSASPLTFVDGHEYQSQFARVSGGLGDFLAAHIIAIGA
jgi:hypothetical protein